jgi:hypothetical protein
MNTSLMSFLLVLLIDGICSVAAYLKDRLMRHMQGNHEYGFGHEPEYA